MGVPLEPDRVRRRFRSFLIANELPVLTYKNLRHTYATLHLDTGISDLVLSKAMGHTRPSTTNTFYRRVDRRHQQDAAKRLEALLSATAEQAVAGGLLAAAPKRTSATPPDDGQQASDLRVRLRSRHREGSHSGRVRRS